MQFSALQSLSVFFVERTLKKPEAILFAVVFVFSGTPNVITCYEMRRTLNVGRITLNL